jgi:serpin B
MTLASSRRRSSRTAIRRRRHTHLLDALEPRTLFSMTIATMVTPASVVAQDNNAFAFDLFHQLQPDQDGNSFFSPYSIATALEMTLQGAKGNTATEILHALHLPPYDFAKIGIQALYQLFQANPDTAGYTLSTANRLWVKENFPLLQSFLTDTQNLFGAGAQPMDFSNPTAAADTINAWVSDQTHGKIKDLISKDAINQYTRLILTNAIYFKGDWATAFNADATRTIPFHSTDSESAPSQMMHQTADFRYYSQTGPNGFQALDLPYQGDNVDMLIILPTASTLDGFQALFTKDLYYQITSNLSTADVNVYLPKFKLEESYDLGKPLYDLGINTAFSDDADFSGITSDPNGIKIDSVVHKSFVQVDEKGTEAAAATGIGMVRCTSVGWTPPQPILFNADHPFLFAIRERSTNTILFLGQVSDPGNFTDGKPEAPSASTPLPSDPIVSPSDPIWIPLPVWNPTPIATFPIGVLVPNAPTDTTDSSTASVLPQMPQISAPTPRRSPLPRYAANLFTARAATTARASSQAITPTILPSALLPLA